MFRGCEHTRSEEKNTRKNLVVVFVSVVSSSTNLLWSLSSMYLNDAEDFSFMLMFGVRLNVVCVTSFHLYFVFRFRNDFLTLALSLSYSFGVALALTFLLS